MMSRRILIALVIASLLAATIPVSNAGSDNGKGYADIKPYNGLFGADSPFYGVKLFVQHVDVSLEGNVTAKLQKQQNLAWQRLSEALAVADRNDADALKAALDAFIEESKLSSKILDSDLINDTAFLEAWNNYDDLEGFLTAMANNSSYSPAITDLYSQTLINADTIKSGRPFIWCENTSMAYFLPPGQIKKIEAAVSAGRFGTNHTPAGLGKKGYNTPEPLRLENGTIVWPWDDGYNDYVAIMNSDMENGVNDKVALFSQTTKHGKGNGKGNLGGKGNGKK